ncbi:hypothetical protein [Nostoc sp. FACHB-280]|uniref:hypothetical protein n=1 Tax=Nostoc sp. FACHB-280 TaxID=2692839 RepID=UPI00168AD987|nr:hypothetical protein [Nostoc sp. FACHB-280]MBD2495572.1 hypothetical protein [Nostoc sp. FACHB-280]
MKGSILTSPPTSLLQDHGWVILDLDPPAYGDPLFKGVSGKIAPLSNNQQEVITVQAPLFKGGWGDQQELITLNGKIAPFSNSDHRNLKIMVIARLPKQSQTLAIASFRFAPFAMTNVYLILYDYLNGNLNTIFGYCKHNEVKAKGKS